MKLTKKMVAEAAAKVTFKNAEEMKESCSPMLLIFVALNDKETSNRIFNKLFGEDAPLDAEIDIDKESFSETATSAIKDRISENEGKTDRNPMLSMTEALRDMVFVSDLEEELFGKEADTPAETEGDADA